jgi:hypothetical protein
MSARVNLGDINVDLDLSGDLDFGLDELANRLGLGVKADVGLANIGVNGALDVGLDDIRLKELPVIRAEASIKEIPVIRTNSKVDLGLDNIRIQELPPIRFELSFKPLRVHFPLNYSFCLELLGIRLFKFSVCGEGMVVTEDYQPRATERCR